MTDIQLSILDTGFILGFMGSMQEYAHLIRSEMERQGIGGQQIADTLGIGQSMVSDIVNGKKKNPPSPEVFKGIGRILGISPVRMMESLGYLDPHGDREGEEPLNRTDIPDEVALALRGIEWDPETTRDVASVISVIAKRRQGFPRQNYGPSTHERKPKNT